MSKDFVQDIKDLHDKMGHTGAFKKLSPEMLYELMRFRLEFLNEELTEGQEAFDKRNADDFVDAMIDLIVVAIGTLDAADVDIYTAWNRVHSANMSKNPGVNPTRPNPFGLPDMIKPDGFVAPSHADNTGNLW